MKKSLLLLNFLLALFALSLVSCSKDDSLDEAKDEYYVKYTISVSGGYEMSYNYVAADGSLKSGRSKPTSFTVGPVYSGFSASISIISQVWKNGCSIEISKNGGTWMPVASYRSPGHQGSGCGYTIP